MKAIDNDSENKLRMKITVLVKLNEYKRMCASGHSSSWAALLPSGGPLVQALRRDRRRCGH